MPRGVRLELRGCGPVWGESPPLPRRPMRDAFLAARRFSLTLLRAGLLLAVLIALLGCTQDQAAKPVDPNSPEAKLVAFQLYGKPVYLTQLVAYPEFRQQLLTQVRTNQLSQDLVDVEYARSGLHYDEGFANWLYGQFYAQYKDPAHPEKSGEQIFKERNSIGTKISEADFENDFNRQFRLMALTMRDHPITDVDLHRTWDQMPKDMIFRQFGESLGWKSVDDVNFEAARYPLLNQAWQQQMQAIFQTWLDDLKYKYLASGELSINYFAGEEQITQAQAQAKLDEEAARKKPTQPAPVEPMSPQAKPVDVPPANQPLIGATKSVDSSPATEPAKPLQPGGTNARDETAKPTEAAVPATDSTKTANNSSPTPATQPTQPGGTPPPRAAAKPTEAAAQAADTTKGPNTSTPKPPEDGKPPIDGSKAVATASTASEAAAIPPPGSAILQQDPSLASILASMSHDQRGMETKAGQAANTSGMDRPIAYTLLGKPITWVDLFLRPLIYRMVAAPAGQGLEAQDLRTQLAGLMSLQILWRRQDLALDKSRLADRWQNLIDESGGEAGFRGALQVSGLTRQERYDMLVREIQARELVLQIYPVDESVLHKRYDSQSRAMWYQAYRQRLGLTAEEQATYSRVRPILLSDAGDSSYQQHRAQFVSDSIDLLTRERILQIPGRNVDIGAPPQPGLTGLKPPMAGSVADTIGPSSEKAE